MLIQNFNAEVLIFPPSQSQVWFYLFLVLFVCFKFTSAEKFTSQEGKLSALKSGQFGKIESPRTRPNLERAYSEKESPVVQKLAAPDEEEMDQGEDLPLAEESENPLSSKVRILFIYF